jgi:hypothetical protein
MFTRAALTALDWNANLNREQVTIKYYILVSNRSISIASGPYSGRELEI